MTNFTYQVLYLPDDTFWKKLTELPQPKVGYSVVIELGSARVSSLSMSRTTP